MQALLLPTCTAQRTTTHLRSARFQTKIRLKASVLPLAVFLQTSEAEHSDMLSWMSAAHSGVVINGAGEQVSTPNQHEKTTRAEEVPTCACPAVSPPQDGIIHQNCLEETLWGKVQRHANDRIALRKETCPAWMVLGWSRRKLLISLRSPQTRLLKVWKKSDALCWRWEQCSVQSERFTSLFVQTFICVNPRCQDVFLQPKWNTSACLITGVWDHFE